MLHITPYLTESKQVSGVVVSFVDVTRLRNEEDGRQRLQAVIDSLSEQIAVVDPSGEISFVNLAWSQFARDNAEEGLERSLGVGANYLTACETVPEVRSLISAVVIGEKEQAMLEYPCHSRKERRWFVMNVRRLADGSGVVISHTNVTEHRALLQQGARS
jgi:two-component system CheB/CheR fusion protein